MVANGGTAAQARDPRNPGSPAGAASLVGARPRRRLGVGNPTKETRDHRTIRPAAAATLAIATLAAGAGGALAAKPESSTGQVRETFFDDFIFDLCGIETMSLAVAVEGPHPVRGIG